MHREPVPRAGGLGIVIPLLLMLGVFGLGGEVLPVLAGTALMLLVGLADDVFCLSPAIKLLFQSAAALAAVLGSGGTEGVGTLFAVLWVVLLTNAHNLVDGMDGLFCGCAMIECLMLGASLWLSASLGWEVTLLLLAALLAFRLYNRHPACVFAGDCGSEAVGFLLGGLTLSLFGGGEALSSLSPLFLFAYPLVEVLTTVLRRLFRARSLFLADRAHLHHRLSVLGLSVPECVTLLEAVSASLGGVGVLLSSEALYPYAAVAALGAVGVLVWVKRYIARTV
jgi:UDP-GlcNAc:undecaprenyl-phosphate GlcNAc-1-phosphate transferase